MSCSVCGLGQKSQEPVFTFTGINLNVQTAKDLKQIVAHQACFEALIRLGTNVSKTAAGSDAKFTLDPSKASPTANPTPLESEENFSMAEKAKPKAGYEEFEPESPLATDEAAD